MRQIEGNPLIHYELKEDLIELLNKMSEPSIKDMAKGDKGRFFYRNSMRDMAKQIIDKMPESTKKQIQTATNKLARKGEKHPNSIIAKNFSTTYRRGGHKYVNGVREY